MNKLISIVIPAFNEAENIPKISSEIENIFESSIYRYEIIFVVDGSTDNTMAVIQELINTGKPIYYIEFSRNFGHQLALKAGLDKAFGDCVITMDCDLQHPPQLIPELIAKWEDGFEVVYTIRREDKRLSYSKRFTSKSYYKLLNGLSSVELEAGCADFRLLDRSVITVFREFSESDPFLRGLIKWMGFKQFAITYDPAQRFSGISKYDFKKMTKLAMQGVTSFSIRPLYGAIYLGFAFSLMSLLYIPYIIHAFYTGEEVSGWASIIMTIVFFGGIQLIILGIIGIYIGKMFMQGKNRPNYIIRSTNIIS